jgi:23S rRNA U2552 (ribose-2'-O)-methylase RlmE/FtsJ
VSRTQLSKRVDPFKGNSINPTAMLKLVERHHIIPVDEVLSDNARTSGILKALRRAH